MAGSASAGIAVASSGFDSMGPIPKRYTGDGSDLSPPLAWKGVPAEAKELVVICDDPDAPSAQPWVHWVVYGLSPASAGLNEADGSGVPGRNSWGTKSYRGPAPPRGKPHRYYFKVYASDRELRLAPGLDKAAVLKALEGHVIGYGEVAGTYER